MNAMDSPTFNSYSQLLDQTSRRVKQYAQNQFKAQKFGLTVDQWIILKKMNESQGLSQTELGELIGKDAPTLTRIIDLLVQKGFADRQSNDKDRRKFHLYLTTAGAEIVQALSPKIELIRQKAWQNLDHEDFEHFKKTLNTIYQNLA